MNYFYILELSSCIDYQLRCYPSGLYELDFDGLDGPLPTVEAYCDMSTVPPTTIVYPTNSCHNKVKDSQSMSYNMSVEYGISHQVKPLSKITKTFVYY